MRVRCPVCEASWPSDAPEIVCPVCTMADPNAGGSPDGVEAEDEDLLRRAETGLPVDHLGPDGGRRPEEP